MILSIPAAGGGLQALEHNDIHVKKQKIQHRGKCRRSCSETSPGRTWSSPASGKPCTKARKVSSISTLHCGHHSYCTKEFKIPSRGTSGFRTELILETQLEFLQEIPQQQPSKFTVWLKGGWNWWFVRSLPTQPTLWFHDHGKAGSPQDSSDELSHHHSSFSKLIKPAVHFLKGLETLDLLWPAIFTANTEFKLLHPLTTLPKVRLFDFCLARTPQEHH